jgi:hypothetical protein
MSSEILTNENTSIVSRLSDNMTTSKQKRCVFIQWSNHNTRSPITTNYDQWNTANILTDITSWNYKIKKGKMLLVAEPAC